MNIAKKIILVGGFSEIIELCELSNVEITGIIDNQLQGKYRGYKIIGTDRDACKLFKRFNKFPVVISPDMPRVRRQLSELYEKIGFDFCNLIHPLSTISKSASLGIGVIIQNGVNLSADVVINNFVKMNTRANVMHGCVIGGFSTIAPNAVVLGRVKIGEGCYIGANATILNDLLISDGAVVGAAAIVVKNVAKNKIVKGNPAR